MWAQPVRFISFHYTAQVTSTRLGHGSLVIRFLVVVLVAPTELPKHVPITYICIVSPSLHDRIFRPMWLQLSLMYGLMTRKVSVVCTFVVHMGCREQNQTFKVGVNTCAWRI